MPVNRPLELYKKSHFLGYETKKKKKRLAKAGKILATEKKVLKPGHRRQRRKADRLLAFFLN